MEKEKDLNELVKKLNNIYNTNSFEIDFGQMTKIEDKISDIIYNFKQIYNCLNILKLSLSSTEEIPTTENIEQFLDTIMDNFRKELIKSNIIKNELLKKLK